MIDMETVQVTYFSDVLCVWAYVSQVRVDELITTFEDQVDVRGRCLSVFGDAVGKLERGWSERGGTAGYADHVQSVAARFDHAPVNRDAWRTVVPRSSMPAHLVLSAARASNVPATDVRRLAWNIRTAFFVDVRDISKRGELLDICKHTGIDSAAIASALDDGSAHGVLSADHAIAKEAQIRVSPSFIFNERRQVLNGNVGYRVIEANVRELLREPADEQSWC